MLLVALEPEELAEPLVAGAGGDGGGVVVPLLGLVVFVVLVAVLVVVLEGAAVVLVVVVLGLVVLVVVAWSSLDPETARSSSSYSKSWMSKPLESVVGAKVGNPQAAFTWYVQVSPGGRFSVRVWFSPGVVPLNWMVDSGPHLLLSKGHRARAVVVLA
jgi:hypothetical protein